MLQMLFVSLCCKRRFPSIRSLFFKLGTAPPGCTHNPTPLNTQKQTGEQMHLELHAHIQFTITHTHTQLLPTAQTVHHLTNSS